MLGNPDAPAFNAFARKGAILSGYRGVTHPSLPNYLALVSGSTHGITSDCTSCTVAGRSLADTLEARHLTWKTYAEGLPRPGWTGPSRGRYAKRHVPFLYFRRVLSSPARLRRIVPLTQLARDRAAGKLPNFALVVPDLCHDMHDCSVATGDAWLKRFLPPLLKLPGTAVFVVFDESDSADPGVPALALGPLVRPTRAPPARWATTACCGRSRKASGCRCWAARRARCRSPASGVFRPRPRKRDPRARH